jgi:hypothetical protein
LPPFLGYNHNLECSDAFLFKPFIITAKIMPFIGVRSVTWSINAFFQDEMRLSGKVNPPGQQKRHPRLRMPGNIDRPE